jgi:hypothetical protein
MKFSDTFKRKFLKAAGLGGKPRRLTIAKVGYEQVGDEEKLVVGFKEIKQGLVLNETNTNTLMDKWGDETAKCLGKVIILRPDKTDFSGKRVDCIRIAIPPDNDPPPAEPEQGADEPKF